MLRFIYLNIRRYFTSYFSMFLRGYIVHINTVLKSSVHCGNVFVHMFQYLNVFFGHTEYIDIFFKSGPIRTELG